MTIRVLATAGLVALLGACATNRGNPDDYERVSSGTFDQAKIQQFADCANDAFSDRTIGLGVVLFNREQRRTGMRRIELVGNEVGPMLSADIWDDGRYELYEITYPVRFRVQGERSKFDQCAARAAPGKQ